MIFPTNSPDPVSTWFTEKLKEWQTSKLLQGNWYLIEEIPHLRLVGSQILRIELLRIIFWNAVEIELSLKLLTESGWRPLHNKVDLPEKAYFSLMSYAESLYKDKFQQEGNK